MDRTDPDAPPTHKATVLVASGRGVAARWHAQYFQEGRWLPHGANGKAAEIYDKLCALGENPDPHAVAEVIGNKSWSFISCDACSDRVERAVRLGEGFSDRDPVLCRACCFEGTLALMSQSTDKARALDERVPGWRADAHHNGQPKFAPTGPCWTTAAIGRSSTTWTSRTMAKRVTKTPTPAVIQPLTWDIHHSGARQIWCAALTGICASPALPQIAQSLGQPIEAVAVDFANQVMEQVIKRTENQHPTERPMAKENPK